MAGADALASPAARAWLDGPFAEDGPGAVRAALDAVTGVPAGARLEAETAERGRAAAETVATVFGRPPEGLDAALRDRLLSHAGDLRRDPAMPTRALQAAARIFSDASELTEAAAEAGQEAERRWRGAEADLAARLSGAARG